MRARFVVLAGIAAAACDKGDDTASAELRSVQPEADADTDTDTDSDTDSDTDTDTDTDSDTDTDTDTDTDSDTDTDTDTDADLFHAEVQVTVTIVETSEVVCDTTIELVGTPYTGTCSTCEFAYEITGEITAEAGSDCVEGYFQTWSSYLPNADLPQVWMAFSDAGLVYGYYERYNILWRGNYPPGGHEVNWVPNVFDGSIFGYASYAGGVLDWTLDYDQKLPTTYAPTHIRAVGQGIVP
jgi:hypothetical protein